MIIKKYKFHELSYLLPLLEGEDLDNLMNDIKEYGQIEPITLYEGKILDGRNRYQACRKLGIEVKTKEWVPSETSGLTPKQFVISENIMRRHLNVAQRAEVGLLLLEEEEKLAKERQSQIGKEMGKLVGKGQKLENGQAETLTKKIDEISKGRSREIVSSKVKIGGSTLQQAKKIKEVAKTDKKIAEEWEKAKRGEHGVNAVYEKVKEKEKKAEQEKIIREKRLDKDKENRYKILMNLIEQREKEIIPEYNSHLKYLENQYIKTAEIIYEEFKNEIQFSDSTPATISTYLSEYQQKIDFSGEHKKITLLKEEKNEVQKHINKIDEQIIIIREQMNNKNQKIEQRLSDLDNIDTKIYNMKNAIERENNNIIKYKQQIEEL